MRILLVEDDEQTSDYIRQGLSEADHECDIISEGTAAFAHATREPYDVLIIDRMLPGIDGLSLVKALRGAGVIVPALFLTAMDGIDDRVEGLEAGGDDYLVKPFALSELIARVNALGRRPSKHVSSEKTKLVVSDLELDLVRRTCRRGGLQIDLMPREFALLEYMMRNPGKVLTRTMLLERVWQYHFSPQTNVVETHVSRLRAKIDKPFSQPLLHTIRNIGYRLNA